MKPLGLLACALVCAACSNADPYPVQASSGASHPTHGTVASGSTSGVGATTSGGTTGTSTSGGTSGTTGAAFVCAVTDCTAPQVELLTQVLTYPAETPVTSGVTFQDLDDFSVMAPTDSSGYLRVCLDPGTPLAPYLQVTGYEATIFNDFNLQTSECFDQLPLLNVTIWAGLIANLTDLDSTKAAVLVFGRSVDGASKCDLSGWTYWAIAPDGGAVASEQSYYRGEGLGPSETGTSSTGVALLYNIDPALLQIQVLGGQDAGSQGGSGVVEGCVNVGAHAAQYTGFIHLKPEQSAISTFLYLVGDGG